MWRAVELRPARLPNVQSEAVFRCECNDRSIAFTCPCWCMLRGMPAVLANWRQGKEYPVNALIVPLVAPFTKPE